MRSTIIIFSILFASLASFGQENPWQGPSVDFSHGKLKISENRRFLVFEDGTPFFYLGDTGWELFHRLTKADAELYLENRRAKGFTVIQAVALAELDGLNTPNMEGEKPLVDNDPLKPNEKYWAHVDWVIKKAAEKGMFIGLLPTWGDKVDKAAWGTGPVIFNPDNAFKYGQWIATRYKNEPNIIWINGGDRSADGENYAVWDAIGKALRSTDPNHLITFHPWGETTSSHWFHNADWLDFNMMQTGHGQRSYAIYKRFMVADYNKTPAKPCFDGEPRYEDHPVNWNPDVMGWFDDADVRQAAYWGVFSGGHGNTYGCHAIWQMLDEGRQPVGYGRNSWRKDLDLPGAWDMTHLRRLMESRDFLSRIPFNELVVNSYVPETDYIVATRGNGYAMVYIPTGWGAELDLVKLPFKNSRTSWFNPRTGETQASENIPNTGIKTFTPPTKNRGNDWVLILDDAAKK